MTSETIGVTVTFAKPVTFFLRMIGIAEENRLRQKMFGLTEKEQDDKSYQNNVELLAELSEKQPEGFFEPGVIAKGLPDEIVREYFKEKTVIKERLAEYAMRAYFLRLQPDISFL